MDDAHIGPQRASFIAAGRVVADAPSRYEVADGRPTAHRCTRANESFRLMPEEPGSRRTTEARPPSPPCPVARAPSDRQQVARACVGGRVAQLRHRPRLDLADALTGE